MAVTDQPGGFGALEGLRVVDASVFPVVPCANTNFPALMAAEKMPTRSWPGAEATTAGLAR